MNKAKVLVVALALLALMAGTAQGQAFVSAYIGGNFGGNSSNPFTVSPDPGAIPFYEVNYGILLPGRFSPSFPGHLDPAFQGGLKFGAWFEPSGILARFNFPAWMRYTGFYLDFSYHRLNFASRTGTKGVLAREEDNARQWMPASIPFISSTEGNAATLAFMFAFRYGFFPDKEVPFGRVQPYIGVGPAILFSSQVPYAFSPPHPWYGKKDPFPSDSSVNIALAVETGVRWVCLKNVFLEASFKYRYAQPCYNFKVRDEYGWYHRVRMTPIYNLFSFQVGAGYQF